MTNEIDQHDIKIEFDDLVLEGLYRLPKDAKGIVVFAHGSGSSRLSPRNQEVAKSLSQRGLATLLFDLLTAEEDIIDKQTSELRFNIPLLAERLVGATDWLVQQSIFQHLKIGYFGSSTGAAAALIAAANRTDIVHAVVSRGGRPDLAGDALPQVEALTLLIVGGLDTTVIELNEQAQEQMHCETKMEIVAGATHLFEEEGTLDKVIELTGDWFLKYLQ